MMDFPTYKNAAFKPAVLWPKADWHKLGTLTAAETYTEPIAAAYILEHCNNRNRHLTSPRSRYLSDVIRAGNWWLTGEPLIFDNEGETLSAQHRLEACLLSGVPILSLVVLDVDPRAADWIDSSRAKTVADRLSAAGKKYSAALAGTARLVNNWIKRGDISKSHHYVFDMDACYKALDACPGLEESVAWTSNHPEVSRFYRGPSVTGTLHWIMEKAYPDAGAGFLAMGASNRIPSEDRWDIVAKLNQQINGWKRGVPTEDVAALVFKAWNIYWEDKKKDRLIADRAQFPRVHGWSYDKKGRPVAAGAFRLPEHKDDKKEEE